jgi:hypothetical protein
MRLTADCHNRVTDTAEIAGLIDHPATFPYVRSTLGWNIHVHHSHLDVHPPVRVDMPFRFDWHQDGGRQSREIETTPRPRLSAKPAYWLSDVSEPRRGSLKVVTTPSTAARRCSSATPTGEPPSATTSPRCGPAAGSGG